MSIEAVKRISSEKKREAQLIVWGCLPRIDPSTLSTVFNGLSFGNDKVEVLDELVNAKISIRDVQANFQSRDFQFNQNPFSRLYRWYSDYFSILRYGSRSYYIKVATGCFGKCTYCAIRKARGTLRSRKLDEIHREFKDGLSQGFKYFNLLATELGAYGREQNLTLVDLLSLLTKEKGNYRLGLRNIHPSYLIEMFDELKPFFESDKIWFLLSPVESGSNRILKLMRREYEVEDYKARIKIINKNYPKIILRTQIMVGFPTETKEDFAKSMDLISELAFDWIEVYRFSRRKTTVADKMEGQIDDEIKYKRYYKLLRKAIYLNIRRSATRVLKRQTI